jgi:NAD(P)-dependent dehydrogenase (short-subunit alcohol dehydrogenase family)
MNRVMIVTGASRGIGAATARLAARDGFDVCVNYLAAAGAAETVAQQVRGAGRRSLVVQGDMGVEADIVRLFETVARELGRPSAVVVNAGGVSGTRRRIDELDWRDLERTITLNLVGAIGCCREAIRWMSTRHGGAGGNIVTVSSVAARLGAPNLWMDYAASKGGVDTLTLGLAVELAEDGIRVNGVRPGMIDTDLHATSGMPDRVARFAKHLPMKRAGTADEVAEAIVWLASPAASYVSGAIIDVAGAR